MKKIAIGMLVLVLSFGSTSCEPWEDESYHDTIPTDEEETEMVGTWKLTEMKLAVAYDLNGDGTESTNFMSETNCYQNELMVFNEDFTGVGTSNSYADITIADGSYTIDCIVEAEDTAFIWTQLQNSITLNVGGQTIEALVEGNTLTYVIPEGFNASDGEEGGVTVSEDITFVYTKQ